MKKYDDKLIIQEFIKNNELVTSECQFEEIYEFLEVYPFDTIYSRDYNKKYYFIIEQNKYCTFDKIVIIKFKTKKLKEAFLNNTIFF